MEKRIFLIGIIAFIALLLVISGCTSAPAAPPQPPNTQQQAPAPSASAASQSAAATPPAVPQASAAPLPTSTTTRLQDTQYAAYAYQIAPGSISPEAQKALIGFDFKAVDLADGSTQVTLTAQQRRYRTQQITVPKGYTLSFIETSWGDDFEPGTDTELGDDTAVLVDPSGYIAQ